VQLRPHGENMGLSLWFFGLVPFIIFLGSKKFLSAAVRSRSPGGEQATLSSVLSAVTGFPVRFFSESHKRPKDSL